MNKIISVDKHGNETFICESIDTYHGSIFVSLMNNNYSTKSKEITYKLVDLSYVLNNVEENNVLDGQIDFKFDDTVL